MPALLTDLLTQSRRPRILVLGDVMLDRYLWGDVGRISPEAPIPVLQVSRREDRLGGAGSVATMLGALDADVRLVAVVGDDPEGQTVVELLRRMNIATGSIRTAADRPTTVKERLLGRTQSRHPQQMIRVDRECTRPVAEDLAERLLDDVRRGLEWAELLLVSDYDKGVCEDRLLAEAIAMANAAGVPVVADPIRDADYGRYAGCACITPNRTEAEMALERRIRSPEEGLDAAERLLAFGVDSAAVTLDRDGIAWADARGHSRLFPVRPRQVYDVTGAGDMVISAIAYAVASGADWPTAMELANLAAGLEVERLGVVPLGRTEILASIAHAGFATGRKILSIEALDDALAARRVTGQRIVMTNGCFDLLHPGHVASLEFARSQGDCLVVGLNSDPSARALKGPGHPVVDQRGRAAMLAALACVDYVVVFDEASVAGLVERVAPDVLVKSAEYAVHEVVGHESVLAHGGSIVLAPREGDYSTTGLIEKIVRQRKAESEKRICRERRRAG